MFNTILDEREQGFWTAFILSLARGPSLTARTFALRLRTLISQPLKDTRDICLQMQTYHGIMYAWSWQ